jgi:hypothetical protein
VGGLEAAADAAGGSAEAAADAAGGSAEAVAGEVLAAEVAFWDMALEAA